MSAMVTLKVLGEIGLDDPEQIDLAHQHEPDCQPDQLADVALEGPRQQNAEWDGEVEDDEEQADLAPSDVEALSVEGDFVGQVAGPDDQPLREVEVGPDHDEGEHPLAVVVNEVGLQHLRHGLVVEEDALDDDGEAHGGEHFADEDDQAEDGGDPAGIERHDPVDGGEGDGEAVEDEAGSGDGFEFLRVVRSAGASVCFDHMREQEREQVPDREVDDGADDEAGGGSGKRS